MRPEQKARVALWSVIAAVLSVMAAAWMAYFARGRQLLEDLYYGRMQSAWGFALEGRSEHPLEFYYRHAESLLITASVLLLIAVVYVFFLIRERRGIARALQAQHGWRMDGLRQSFRGQLHDGALWVALLLLGLFFAFFAWQGSEFLTSNALSEDSLLFEADPLLTTNDMTNFRAEAFSTPARHPLFLLLTNPLGSALSLMMPPTTAALSLNCLFGALGVALAFLVGDRWRGRPFISAALAILFGCTMSQLFVGSITETYALAGCSLLVIYGLTIIAVRQKRIDFWPWVLAGVFAMGVTATNVVQAVICFAFAARSAQTERSRPLLPLVLLYTVEVGAIVVILAVIQKAVYPAADLFFWPFDQRVSFGYVDYSALAHPLTLAARELPHFALLNIVGADPQQIPWPGTDLAALTYDTAARFMPIGRWAAVLWLGMLVYGLIAALRYREQDRTVLKAFLLCVGFSFLLHTFYGTGVTGRTEFFLYSAHWTFPVLFLATAAWAHRQRFSAVFLLVTAFILFTNNAIMLWRIRSFYPLLWP